MARPTKLGNHIVEAFQAVLDEDMNVLVCTDSQLFFLLNERLGPDEYISYRSFQRYKMFATLYGAKKSDFVYEDESHDKTECFPEIYRELYRLFTHALIKQKKALFTKMLGDVHGWHRYRWILERKFREWRVKWDDPDEKREQQWLNEEELGTNEISDYEIKIVPAHLDNDEHIEGERKPLSTAHLSYDDPGYRHPRRNPNAKEGDYFMDGNGNHWWSKTGLRKWEEQVKEDDEDRESLNRENNET